MTSGPTRPSVGHRVVGVAGAQAGVETGPARLVDPLGAAEQQLADVIERVALPAPVLEGLLLDTHWRARVTAWLAKRTTWNGSTTTVACANGPGRPVRGSGRTTAPR